MNVNEMVVELRKHYSRSKLVELTGISPAKIYNLERGRTPRPEEVTAVELAWHTHNARELAKDVVIDDLTPVVEDVDPIPTEQSPLPTDIVIPEGVQLAPLYLPDLVNPSQLISHPEPTGGWTSGPTGNLYVAPLDPDGDDLELIQWVDVGHTSDTIIPGTHHSTNFFEVDEPVIEVIRAFEGGEIEVTAPLPSPTVMSTLDGYRRYANSEVQTFKQCRRRWYLAYYRGLRLRHEDPVGPKFIGDRVHRALERWYLPDPALRTDPRDALERLIVDDWTALVQRYATNWVETGEGVPAEVSKKFGADADMERVMLDGYVRWVEESGADHEYRVVGAEEYREAVLEELDHVMVITKLDARLIRESDKARLNLEHKTTADLKRLTHFLHLDEQNQWQIMVERGQEGDDSYVAGTLFNMLKRVKRTARATPPFYQRVEVHRNPTETENFRERVVGTLMEVEHVRLQLDTGESHRRVAYPTPTSDCSWRCPFVAICGMFDDGSRVEQAIESYYEVGDPLDYYVR